MPNDSKTKTEYFDSSYSTYGQKPVWIRSTRKYTARHRVWAHSSYKTAAARAKATLSNGFLPTLGYTANRIVDPNCAPLRIRGQLTSNPAAQFTLDNMVVAGRTLVSLDDADLSQLRLQALSNLQGKLQGQANLPVTIAEAGKTVDMIATRVASFAAGYSSFRKGNFSAAAAHFRSNNPGKGVPPKNSAMWLEYRYGWRLLAADVYALTTSAWELLRDRRVVQRVSSRLDQAYDRVSNIDIGVSLPSGVTIGTLHAKKVIRWECSSSVGYYYHLENPNLSSASYLGLTNPALLAWELIPLSFVIDWFLNVGDVLTNLSAFQGKVFLDGWDGKLIRSTTRYAYKGFTPASGVKIFSVNWPGAEVIDERFVRARLPGFVPNSLNVQFGMNIPRALDAIALLAGGRKASGLPGLRI